MYDYNLCLELWPIYYLKECKKLKMNSKEILDNCKGHEVIKINKGSDMCQFCFINVLKLKTMINRNWHMFFLYSVSPWSSSFSSLLMNDIQTKILVFVNPKILYGTLFAPNFCSDAENTLLVLYRTYLFYNLTS